MSTLIQNIKDIAHRLKTTDYKKAFRDVWKKCIANLEVCSAWLFMQIMYGLKWCAEVIGTALTQVPLLAFYALTFMCAYRAVYITFDCLPYINYFQWCGITLFMAAVEAAMHSVPQPPRSIQEQAYIETFGQEYYKKMMWARIKGCAVIMLISICYYYGMGN